MKHYLEALPYDWTRPVSSELRDIAVEAYPDPYSIRALLFAARLPLYYFNLMQPPRYLWNDILERARMADKQYEVFAIIAASAPQAFDARAHCRGLNLRAVLAGCRVVLANESPLIDEIRGKVRTLAAALSVGLCLWEVGR